MSREQSTLEEKANAATHAVGIGLGLVGWFYLVVKAIPHESAMYLLGFSLFGVALIAQFIISFLYHSETRAFIKDRLHVWDHALIYVLIAGSYSPFALIVLSGTTRITLLVFIWATALAGVLFKLRFTGRMRVFSTLLYLAMGWSVVTVIEPISAGMTTFGLTWLVIGGVSYSIGALFYLFDTMRFNHTVFHLFVLLGGLAHVIAAGTVA